jgi:hypothetical protein
VFAFPTEETCGWLQKRGAIQVEPGLTLTETEAIEQKYNFCFPPDLRRCLQTILPVSEGFPNWRSGLICSSQPHAKQEVSIASVMHDLPEQTLMSAIERGFWHEAFGPDLSFNLDEARTKIKQLLATAPPLIPVRYNYYVPGIPGQPNLPVIYIAFGWFVDSQLNLGRFLSLRRYTALSFRGGPVLAADRIPFWGSLLCSSSFYQTQNSQMLVFKT